MRAAVLALVLLAGCRCESGPQPNADGTAGPAPKDSDPVARPAWYSVAVGGLELQLPETFRVDTQHSRPQQPLFLEDRVQDGFRATVTVFTQAWEQSDEEWAEHNRLKVDYPTSPRRLLDKTWTTLGGRRAYRLIYEFDEVVPRLGNRKLPFVIIDWYFVHRGRAGFVRGISVQRRFALEYRPLFEEIARRVRYPAQ